MTKTLTSVAVGIALLLGATAAAQAQARNGEQCVAALKTLVNQDATADVACGRLAIAIATKVTEAAAAAVLKPDAPRKGLSQRDLQSRAQPAAGLGGTPAQGHALPSVQPTGVAAGTIAAFGTNSGQDSIAALSINPAVLFLGDLATKAFAKASRVADITVFIPVSSSRSEDAGAPTAPASDKLRYFGARLRLNVNGVKAGDQVWGDADKLISKFTLQTAQVAGKVAAALRDAPAPTVGECAKALFNGDSEETLISSCGANVTFEVDLAQAEQLRVALAAVRRKADSKYFGADVRMDFGDPTLGEVENAAGRYLFGGFAFGVRRDRAAADGTLAHSVGLRGRLGARHATLDSEPTPELAVDWGIGLEVVRYVGDEEVNLSVAVEGRHGNAEERLFTQLQSNAVMLRGSVSLPVTGGNSVSLNLGYPIAGKAHASPVFSVSFNWAVLLSNAVGR